MTIFILDDAVFYASKTGIEFLQKKYNFNNLYNLKGGILAWADEIDESIEKY